MRYAQSGGLTAERRAFREQVRLEAEVRFEAGEKTSAIARDLRVSERSVERWRRAWREGGVQALRSASRAAEPLSAAAAPRPTLRRSCWPRPAGLPRRSRGAQWDRTHLPGRPIRHSRAGGGSGSGGVAGAAALLHALEGRGGTVEAFQRGGGERLHQGVGVGLQLLRSLPAGADHRVQVGEDGVHRGQPVQDQLLAFRGQPSNQELWDNLSPGTARPGQVNRLRRSAACARRSASPLD
ncbi:helix-turn-helix domain-containing protein [Streptomyces albidoflavus]